MRETCPTILGAGSWGGALALVLARKGLKVRLWGHDPEHIEKLIQTRENTPYLPEIHFPELIIPTSDLKEAVENASVLVVVVPSRVLRDLGNSLASLNIPAALPLLTCTKGIEFRTGLTISGVLEEIFPQNPIAVLSGPSHAEEVSRAIPTAVVIGARGEELACDLQQLFSGDNFRVYTSRDVLGIELGGALKNIYAIAAGVSDGLGLGDNTKSALITRALSELTRLGTAMGGKRETFQGLSGIGDLMVTCFSRHSRNRGVGERLGRGETPEAIVASMKMVAEGVPTTNSAYVCARNLNVNTPILDVIYAILNGTIHPKEAMVKLLTRDLRSEED